MEGEGTDDDQHPPKFETGLTLLSAMVNKYIAEFRAARLSENVNGAEGIPPEREEPTSRSPSVTRETFSSMNVATMDMAVEDDVLPTKSYKAVRVPAF